MHVGIFLGENGVHAHGGLADLTVTDNQFALTASDRRNSVNGLDAGHHGLVYALAGHEPRSLELHRAAFVCFNGAHAVQRLPQGVQHATDHSLADGHGENLPGTLDRIPFLDAGIIAQKRDTDIVFFEVEHHAHDSAGKLEQFHGHGVIDPIHAGNAVPHVQYGASLAHFHALVVVADLILDDLSDLFSLDVHGLLTPLDGFPEVIELRAQARVQNGISHFEHKAAQNGGICRPGKFELAPCL